MAVRRRIRKKSTDPEGTYRVGSVRTFLDVLEEISTSDDEVLYFRGHSNTSYKLVPSIYREDNWIENEDILHKEIILKCPNDFREQENTFQMLVKMQHYSLPTRLLDITANPLIGLYFACSEGKNSGEDGEVIIVRMPKREIRYYDSDTVSVISNISRRPSSFSIPGIKDIKAFNQQQDISYLLHEIKKEKPYFEPIIKKEHLESVVCVKPKLDNPRVIRQDGAFLLFGVSGKKTQSAVLDSKYLCTDLKIIVNRATKQKIIAQLQTLGITKGTIYPEIDKVAEYLKEVYGDDDERELTSKSSGRRRLRR